MIFMLTLAAATLAQASPGQWTHSTPVVHGNSNAIATYVARPVITTRQIGTSGGVRSNTERCLWTAAISVERRLAQPGGAASGAREMASGKILKGSRHGDCTVNRPGIQLEIAAKSPEINAHLVAVAERDQRELRTEIDTLAPPAGR